MYFYRKYESWFRHVSHESHLLNLQMMSSIFFILYSVILISVSFYLMFHSNAFFFKQIDLAAHLLSRPLSVSNTLDPVHCLRSYASTPATHIFRITFSLLVVFVNVLFGAVNSQKCNISGFFNLECLYHYIYFFFYTRNRKNQSHSNTFFNFSKSNIRISIFI